MASLQRKLCGRAVKQRDESNARTANANRTRKTAVGMYRVSNWRLELSDLLRRESEAEAKTAEAMIVQVATAHHASEPVLRAAEAALCLCQLRMEAANSLATASRLIVGNTLLVTVVDLRKERGMPASTAAAAAAVAAPVAAAACCCCCCSCCCCCLLLLLVVVARRGLLLFRCSYSARIVAAATHKRKKNKKTASGSR